MNPCLLSLSDKQLRTVRQAASMLRPGERDLFLRSIGNRLGGIHTPTNHDLQSAITLVLSGFGISVSRLTLSGQQQESCK